MSHRRDIEAGKDDLGERVRRYADDTGDAARGWIARGKLAATRFDGDRYRRRLARAAEDFADGTGYRYRRLRRQVNRHPLATAAILAGAVGALLLLRSALRRRADD